MTTPTDAPTATGAELRRGPFRVGDKVQLTDPKGRLHTITLQPGGTFHTHKGYFKHEQIIGQPEGSVVVNTAEIEYLALRPLLADYVLSMPRGAAVAAVPPAAQHTTQVDAVAVPFVQGSEVDPRMSGTDLLNHLAARSGGARLVPVVEQGRVTGVLDLADVARAVRGT